jgi:thioredoxin reductase (NADPH)
LVSAVTNHIKSLNWGYRVALQKEGIDYINAFASFSGTKSSGHSLSEADPNLVELKHVNGQQSFATASNYLIATGGRPKVPDIDGIEHAITSDDLFSLKNPPGKTLVIGASYVALECAGFLTGLGYDTTVMVRSICLRGFDQDMAHHIKTYMQGQGTTFIERSVPTSIVKLPNGKNQVHSRSVAADDEDSMHTEEYDTVLVATGREPQTSALGLDSVGVKLHADSKKIITSRDEQSTNASIFAVGDVIHGAPELTPTAIMAGKLLARRLYGGNPMHRANSMDWNNVPTTVFTPLEYGCVGLSEEDAIRTQGERNIEVFHAFFNPLEWALSDHRPDNACYTKVIVNNADGRIIGMHMLGPNAGEITQGFALAIRCGATYTDLSLTAGIHPTNAEEVVRLDITKRSGKDPKRTGC